MEEGHSLKNLSLASFSKPPHEPDITAGQQAGSQTHIHTYTHTFRSSYADPAPSKGMAEISNGRLTVPCPWQGNAMLTMNEISWHQIMRGEEWHLASLDLGFRAPENQDLKNE